MKRLLFILCVMLISTQVIGQQAPSLNVAPPAVAMPSSSNKVLIDTLLVVTGFELYFNEYANRKIKDAADLNKWSEQVIQQKRNSLNYKGFKEDTMYNWYSNFTTEELQYLIRLFRKINDNNYDYFFVSHPAIQSNLELHLKSVLK